jgi:glycosyltransferase involved in cell wall biosynthesis
MPENLVDVIVLTHNEEANIVAALRSAQGLGALLGELIVIDDQSADTTRSLATKAGARVISRKLDDFASQRNFALTQSPSSWVFFLDADERMSPPLIAAIQKVLASGQKVQGAVKRRVFAFGARQRFGPLGGDYVTRLFPRTEVFWEGLVHERPLCNLPEVLLNGHLEHHTYADWAEYLDKWRRYALLWAKDAKLKGQKATVAKAVSRAFWAFLKMFFGKLGVLGGLNTWALCWYYSGYTLSKYLLLADNSLANHIDERHTTPKDDSAQ